MSADGKARRWSRLDTRWAAWRTCPSTGSCSIWPSPALSSATVHCPGLGPRDLRGRLRHQRMSARPRLGDSARARSSARDVARSCLEEDVPLRDRPRAVRSATLGIPGGAVPARRRVRRPPRSRRDRQVFTVVYAGAARRLARRCAGVQAGRARSGQRDLPDRSSAPRGDRVL
jgi:hypothetical protein